MLSTTFNALKSQWCRLSNAHPLAKGMISYAVIWPTSSLIQQTIEGKNLKTYDWWRTIRFTVYGTFYVAPSLYAWVRLTSAMWPAMSLKTGVTKAIIEQFSYGPFAGSSFFFVMSLLELKTPAEAVHEVQQKFWPTFKVGLCVWPFLQTINFSVIPERNRVVFVSICSLMWTTFLAYMKSKDMKAEQTSTVIGHDTKNTFRISPADSKTLYNFSPQT